VRRSRLCHGCGVAGGAGAVGAPHPPEGSVAADLRPVTLDTLGLEALGEGCEVIGCGLEVAGAQSVLETVSGQLAGDLTDVPLHGVQAVAAVGDVGGADVL